MKLEKEAVKLGAKGARQGIKILWSWYRPWRTKLAYKREVEAEMKKRGEQILKAFVLGLVALSAGCASLDKVYTSVDRTVYNGQLDPYQNQIPSGYDVRPFVRDASGDRVDITGWTVEEEMVKADSWTPRPLAIQSRGQVKANPLKDILAVIQSKQGVSGASDAEALLLEAAKEAGIE